MGMKDVDGGAKKKSTGIANDSKNDQAANRPRKVKFLDEIMVFPLPNYGKHPLNVHEDGLVQGKRFTPEEDQMVRDAVLNFIKVHNLGENGMDIIMNSGRHRRLRGCWKEIGMNLPWRPYMAVYYRAHILFEGYGKHECDSEREIKPPNKKFRHWTRNEYENLFDLVNKDLAIRAHQEKINQLGMLQDNISWEAISEKLTPRTKMACRKKWYEQLAPSMVSEGLWDNYDDHRLLQALAKSDACCLNDVGWDNLLEHRSGNICLKRWKQLTQCIDGYTKPFIEQVEVLSSRYCLDMPEAV